MGTYNLVTFIFLGGKIPYSKPKTFMSQGFGVGRKILNLNTIAYVFLDLLRDEKRIVKYWSSTKRRFELL